MKPSGRVDIEADLLSWAIFSRSELSTVFTTASAFFLACSIFFNIYNRNTHLTARFSLSFLKSKHVCSTRNSHKCIQHSLSFHHSSAFQTSALKLWISISVKDVWIVSPVSSCALWPLPLVWLAARWFPAISACIPLPFPWWREQASSGASFHRQPTTREFRSYPQNSQTYEARRRCYYLRNAQIT